MEVVRTSDPGDIWELHVSEILELTGSCTYSKSEVEAKWGLIESNNFLIAQDGNGEKIGFVAYQVQAESLFISDLFVIKSARRLGWAKAMINGLLELMRPVTLNVDKNNAIAIKLYTSLGFQKIGENKGRYEMRYQRS